MAALLLRSIESRVIALISFAFEMSKSKSLVEQCLCPVTAPRGHILAINHGQDAGMYVLHNYMLSYQF